MEEISFFQIIYDFLIRNQFLSYLIIFLIAFLESAIFIGLLIPAGTLMLAFGFLAYGGYLITAYVIFFTILGAVLGDTLNYSLGNYHIKKHRLKNIEKTDKLLRKKHYLEHGREFFEKHGRKSVLLGRFIGVIRPFIGFIAGNTNMPLLRFLYFSILGAILWVLFYFEIGYLFGSSLEIFIPWIKRVENIFLVILLMIISFLYLKNLMRQEIKPKVLEKSNEILEGIEKK